MHGPDNGSATRRSVSKRQKREGVDVSLESGPEEPASANQGKEDLRGYYRLLRGIIIQSISDLGSLSGLKKTDLIDFIDSVKFEELCDLAAWNVEWVRDVASGVVGLRPAVRHEITRQSVEMMKTLARRG